MNPGTFKTVHQDSSTSEQISAVPCPQYTQLSNLQISLLLFFIATFSNPLIHQVPGSPYPPSSRLPHMHHKSCQTPEENQHHQASIITIGNLQQGFPTSSTKWKLQPPHIHSTIHYQPPKDSQNQHIPILHIPQTKQ
jgi:hypothetical protein